MKRLFGIPAPSPVPVQPDAIEDILHNPGEAHRGPLMDLLPDRMKPVYGWYGRMGQDNRFRGEVRNVQGETIFSIVSPDEDNVSFFDYGFMDDVNDVPGLHRMLVSFGKIERWARILPEAEFEAECRMRQEILRPEPEPDFDC